MKKASIADKERVINILAGAFDTNPSVNWVLPKEENRTERLAWLMKYAADVSFRHHEVFLHETAPAAMLCHFPHRKRFSIADIGSNIQFAVKVTGLKGALRAAKRESLIKAQHPQIPFMYLWMIGVSPDHQGKGAGSDLLKSILDRCDREGLPAYLETSVEKNLPLYHRHGFAVYHNLHLDDLHIRFMRREPRI